jgi:hypothetical protein
MFSFDRPNFRPRKFSSLKLFRMDRPTPRSIADWQINERFFTASQRRPWPVEIR